MWRLVITYTGPDGVQTQQDILHANEDFLRMLTRVLRGNTTALARVTNTVLMSPPVVTQSEVTNA